MGHLKSAAILLLPGVISGCGDKNPPVVPSPAADLMVSIQGGAITAPDSLGPGWTHLRVEEDGNGHILVVFRLREGADPAAFLTALDTASRTPDMAVALGGPEIGDTGEVIIQLTPGHYMLGCVRRGSNRHRHAATGESRMLLVTQAPVIPGRDTAPAATQNMQLVDFAYVGPDRWTGGPQVLRVENAGHQDHQLRLVQLPPGTTATDWMNAEDPGEVGTPIAGVARMGPGAVVYLPLELAPATYVAYCLITDPGSGREHVLMGMMKAIQVGDEKQQ
jgi:hypothetical protein